MLFMYILMKGLTLYFSFSYYQDICFGERERILITNVEFVELEYGFIVQTVFSLGEDVAAGLATGTTTDKVPMKVKHNEF